MSTESKAHKYLTEGKVKAQHVGESSALFHVMGSNPEPYFVKHSTAGWSCDCPARVPECAHVIAAQLVTAFSNSEKPTLALTRDQTIDDLLGLK